MEEEDDAGDEQPRFRIFPGIKSMVVVVLPPQPSVSVVVVDLMRSIDRESET